MDFFAAKTNCGHLEVPPFRMSTYSLGDVFVKEWSESAEVMTHLLKELWTPVPEELPSLNPPHGLSAK